MLKVINYTAGILEANNYLLYDDASGECALVDCSAVVDVDEILGKHCNDGVQSSLKLKYILLTHGHFDHMQGAEELRKLTGAKIYALDEEEEICKDSYLNLSANWSRTACVIEPDAYLHDGDVCEEAGMKFCVIATPGHTKGSCAFYFEEDGVLVSGDTLFEESTGRTDFPTGSMSTLIRSIKDKLFVLPDDVKVFSGHGDMTTIGHEKKYNPFVQ